MKGQLEPLKEIVPVYSQVAEKKSSRLVKWPRETKLYKIRDLIEFQD